MAGRAPGHSPGRRSYAASQGEAEHGVRRVVTGRRWRAEVVSAVGIVAIVLDLLWRDQNVLPVLPAPCVDVAAGNLDLGGVAIRIVAAASGGIVRHVPRRIELLVQSLVLRGMLVLCRCGRGEKESSVKNSQAIERTG